MKRRTLLGPYELISGSWYSVRRMEEGTVRRIEGKLYYAVDAVLKDTPDIMTRENYTNASRWVLVDSQE